MDRTPSARTDVCVIGSGPAGALAAYSLAEMGHDVVILEAGKRFDFEARKRRMERSLRPAHGPLEVWEMGGDRDAYTSSGKMYYPLNRKRVKGVGGTSLHWGGTVWRMHPEDFETDSRYGFATDWPISYRDLRPYYERAETEIGVAATADNPFTPPRRSDFPMSAFPPSYSDTVLVDACNQLGIATHSVPRAQNSEARGERSACVGYGTCAPVCPSGAKYSADVHVRKAEAESARLVDRAPVQSLRHDASGTRVTAAVYATPDGTTYQQEARQFVIACGGIETPRLLLLSASDTHPDGLANSSGLVGQYFMEHPGGVISGRVDEPTGQHRIGFNTTGSQQFYGNDSPGPGSFNLTFENNAGPLPVEMALRGGDARPRNDLKDPFTGDEWGDELLATLREKTGQSLGISFITEQRPRRENRVTLDTSKTDDHGNPVPDVSWQIGSRARETISYANEIGRRILAEAGAKEIAPVSPGNPFLPAHHMGTTRMGTDPTESVVSARLRTHDLENLFIASSSVFVTSSAVNPTLTITALALKAANHVHEEL